MYIDFTGDYSILDIEEPYVMGELLPNGVDERYDVYLESKQKDSKKPHIGFFTCISLDLTYFAIYINNCNPIPSLA